MLINLSKPSQQVNFEQAIYQGLGENQGLFFPRKIQPIHHLSSLLLDKRSARNTKILAHLTLGEIPTHDLRKIVDKVFSYELPLKPITDQFYCLELFHGPTYAFKDIGAKFLAECLQYFQNNVPSEQRKTITILTATSGDTGAAVARAFYGLDNVRVVVLFPAGKISEIQRKLFTTLDKNIISIAIDGDFDACQKMVKQCFFNQTLVKKLNLTSANSINYARLIAQTCYYFDAVAQLPQSLQHRATIAVPSGNFGNLCAAIIAKCLGLPLNHLIAATNSNDTIPRYLSTKQWRPHTTKATLSNAMDVSQPNNWQRIQYLIDSQQFDSECLSAVSVSDSETTQSLRQLFKENYMSEPHAAVAFNALLKLQSTNNLITRDSPLLFLGTAHPLKFKQSVENILKVEIDLPDKLSSQLNQQESIKKMSTNFNQLQQYLFSLC